MLAQLPMASDATSLHTFREIVRHMDPEAKVLVDQESGEILVKGQLDSEQLAAAIERSGIGMRVVAAGGGGCCGGCGCG